MNRLPFPALPRYVRYAGVLIVAAIIAYFSFTGSVQQPEAAGPWWDKQLHIIAYAALGVSIAYATFEKRRATLRLLLIITGATIYGAGIEIVQYFLPERYFGLGDLTANFTGALLASGWVLVERKIDYIPVPRS